MAGVVGTLHQARELILSCHCLVDAGRAAHLERGGGNSGALIKPAVSKTHSVPYGLPDTAQRPSPLRATGAESSSMVRRQRPVEVCHRRTVWSSLPDNAQRPFALTAVERTRLVWPSRVRRQRPVIVPTGEVFGPRFPTAPCGRFRPGLRKSRRPCVPRRFANSGPSIVPTDEASCRGFPTGRSGCRQ